MFIMCFFFENRPHSIDSMTHRKMTMSLVEHGSKTKKVKILAENPKNPEYKRLELMKKEEEKLKAASRRQNVIRRQREKSHAKGLTAGYLEDRFQSDEEDEAESLAAIKNKFKSRKMSGLYFCSTVFSHKKLNHELKSNRQPGFSSFVKFSFKNRDLAKSNHFYGNLYEIKTKLLFF